MALERAGHLPELTSDLECAVVVASGHTVGGLGATSYGTAPQLDGWMPARRIRKRAADQDAE